MAFDIIASLLTIAYGLTVIRRPQGVSEIWRMMAMPMILGPSGVRTAVQGIKNGDITFDEAMGLLTVGACVGLVVLSIKIARADARLRGR